MKYMLMFAGGAEAARTKEERQRLYEETSR